MTYKEKAVIFHYYSSLLELRKKAWQEFINNACDENFAQYVYCSAQVNAIVQLCFKLDKLD